MDSHAKLCIGLAKLRYKYVGSGRTEGEPGGIIIARGGLQGEFRTAMGEGATTKDGLTKAVTRFSRYVTRVIILILGFECPQHQQP